MAVALWSASEAPPIAVTRNVLPPFLSRDLSRVWLRILGGLWFGFALVVQILHDGIICPGDYECIDDVSLRDRMQMMFTLAWLFIVVGLYIGRRWAALASLGLAGLGVAIATQHMPVVWWATFEIAGFTLLGLSGLVLGRGALRRTSNAPHPVTASSYLASTKRARDDEPFRGFLRRRAAIAAVFLVPAVAIAAFSIPRARRAAAFEATAPHAVGTVVRVSDDGFRVLVVYTHPDAGLQRVALDVTYYEYAPGETVDLLYDPKDPRHIELDGETYDGLSVFFAVALLGMTALWIFGGALLRVRSIERVARSQPTFAMRYRRWTLVGPHGGPWVTLFSNDETDTQPIASYRLFDRPPPLDPWRRQSVRVRGEGFPGGVVIARDDDTIFWPRSRVRISDRFHKKHWSSIVAPPVVPPPVPGPPPPPPPVPEGTPL